MKKEDGMDAIEAMTEAKVVLMEHGWCKGNAENTEGRVCLVGALEKALGLQHIGIAHSLRRHPVGMETMRLLRIITGGVPEWGFNDLRSTSFNDVLGLLDDAILLAKEESRA